MMMSAQRHFLMMAAGDGTGDGGSGGSGGQGGRGTGTGQGAGGQGGDAGDGEDIDPKIAAHVSKIVNAAMTSHSKRLETRLGETLQTSLAKALEGFKPAPAKDGDDAGSGGGGGQDRGTGNQANSGNAAAGADTETAKQLRLLKAEVEEQKRLRQKEKEDADREREDRMRAEEDETVRAALVKMGVPVSRAKGAALLIRDSKMVVRNEKGDICIKMPVTRHGITDEEILSIDKGIEQWSTTADGKDYMPAKDASGSGGRGGNRPGGNAKGAPNTQEAGLAIANAMMTGMFGSGG